MKKIFRKISRNTIVNVGAGLDTTFYRVDNGNIQLYDLDLSDAIEFRRKYISKYIIKYNNDTNVFKNKIINKILLGEIDLYYDYYN